MNQEESEGYKGGSIGWSGANAGCGDRKELIFSGSFVEPSIVSNFQSPSFF